MAKLYNLARMSTATTGTGTITLGSAVSGFLSFASAGAQDGETVTYAIEDGANREIGRGVYTAAGTTLTRSVLRSTNANAAISLSGTAQVFITAAAEDFMEAAGSSGQLQFNSSGYLAGMAGATWDNTNRSLTLGGATLATSQPVLNLSQTWNAVGVTFTGLDFNVTDTASAAGSGIADFRVGGSSIARVGKAASNALTLVNSGVISSASTGGLFLGSSGGTPTLTYASGISLGSAATLGWSSASTPTTSPDTLIRRVSSGVIQFGTDGAFPSAYTLQISNSIGGATNINGPNFTIRAGFSTGTGVGGSLIFQVSPAGSSGATLNAGVSALTIAATRVITIADAFDLAFNATTGSKIGTATTQKIGFWNATPIVQPTTAVAAATVAATGTGDVVAASTTFDGYTIPQVVKALRNAGLLA